MPWKNSVAYTKNGESFVTKGVSWTEHTSVCPGKLEDHEYTNRQGALEACTAKSTCKMIVMTTDHKFKLAIGTGVVKRTGYITYEMGSTTENIGDYTWSVMDGTTLTGYYSRHVYRTMDEALMACAKVDRCKGVTQESGNRFMMNNDDEPKSHKGRTAFIKGGMKPVYRTITYGGK